ncbi:MAG: hypothetical protein AAGK14_09920 [Verrucomicrobiota bacterium]
MPPETTSASDTELRANPLLGWAGVVGGGGFTTFTVAANWRYLVNFDLEMDITYTVLVMSLMGLVFFVLGCLLAFRPPLLLRRSGDHLEGFRLELHRNHPALRVPVANLASIQATKVRNAKNQFQWAVAIRLKEQIELPEEVRNLRQVHFLLFAQTANPLELTWSLALPPPGGLRGLDQALRQMLPEVEVKPLSENST